ncbi:hypothetical protein CAPTEDRAFT_178555 [Capitella teleta]|uniref:Arginyl-tRNA--protein transferase 1 n=1 Tax=Capitella teleta TaxID=283909 RepID=R7TU95_CAPTE|nr:hypothetical protein CAPTEDRAFT_178555 [Capitella teleta]|eukprot:ELT94595.1 hypothetical protein CAPTEDRAFT_178555 [Capitella teleta]
MSGRSIVEYLHEHEQYRCGYCGSSDTNYSHGMWAHSLTVDDYQDLIDRGWRRSGKYVYKPTMEKTCCPQYTIKCRASDFKMTKSHKKVIKKCNHYFNEGKKSGKESLRESEGAVEGDGPSRFQFETPQHMPQRTDISPNCEEEKMEMNLSRSCTDVSSGMASQRPVVQPMKEESGVKPNPRAGLGADPSKPPCQKAKSRRRERWMQKRDQQTTPPPPKQSSEKSLEDWLKSLSENPVNKFEASCIFSKRLVRSSPRCKTFNETFDESHAVYLKYQMQIHNDPPEKPTAKQFTRFLVDSPLEPKDGSEAFPDGYGSFHQQYLVNGKIIAVGVIDVLPRCISSVYLYYDPDYHFLSLGTYTALQELSYTRHLHTIEPSIEYYYMGFYIHSCPKMLYKGQYYPSYLLCPVTYSWQTIEKCRPKLDAERFSRLSDDPNAGDAEGSVDLASVLVLYKRQAMPYSFYRMLNSEADDEAEVKEYATFAGKKCAARMLLYRS